MRVIYPYPCPETDSTLDELHVDSVHSNSKSKRFKEREENTGIFLTLLFFCSHVDFQAV